MAETLLINITPMETRVALLDNGNLMEVYIERNNRLGLVGNIYAGNVARVLPGMQAAFVDIGLERTAFLHASDMSAEDVAAKPTAPASDFAELVRRSTPSTGGSVAASIESRLKVGDRVVVQVVKDQLGTKGARLTTDLSLPSRFLVYLPSGSHIGVSQRIEDPARREELRSLMADLLKENNLSGGLIARTAAEGAAKEQLQNDVAYLAKLWRVLSERMQHSSEGLLFSELPLPERTLRDLASADIEAVWVDDPDRLTDMQHFANKFAPVVAKRINLYSGKQPLFDAYKIEEDLQKALERRVDLKSGGYLVIDQTEAMTTIDVNTGSFIGGRSLEDTVYKTNLEATGAIARQLRLRNLGGIIIIDFIDMSEESHRTSVMQALESELARDHAKTNITQVSQLGLIEMTRKRTRESLEHILCEPCQTCSGRGFLKTKESVCYEIFRELIRLARAYEQARNYTIVAHSEVIDLLLSSEASMVADLEAITQSVIGFQVEVSYTQEQYEIILG